MSEKVVTILDGRRPIILVGDFWKPLLDLLAKDDPESGGCVYCADGPEQVRNILVETI